MSDTTDLNPVTHVTNVAAGATAVAKSGLGLVHTLGTGAFGLAVLASVVHYFGVGAVPGFGLQDLGWGAIVLAGSKIAIN